MAMYTLFLMLYVFLLVDMFNVRVEEVIQAGLVPRFVEFLTWDDFPQLQVSFDTHVCSFWFHHKLDVFRFMEQFL